MDELLKRLEEEHGLSKDESQNILTTIKNYIRERFPMVGGALDNFFPSGSRPQDKELSSKWPAKAQPSSPDDFLE